MMASKYYPQQKYSGNLNNDSKNFTTDETNQILDELNKIYNEPSDKEFCLPSAQKGNYEKELEEEIQKIDDEEQRSCASCSTHTRITSTTMFKAGQHIAKPGDYLKKYIEIFRKQVSPYDHHMIVKCVERVSENRAKLKLIHFKKSDDREIKITESTETFDLRYDEVYLVEYRFPLYSRNEIIKRAESMLPEECSEDAKFKKYNLLTENCEHFAVWCVTGRKESMQIQGLFERIKDGAAYIFGHTSAVSKGVQKIILNSVDEIAAELKKAVPSIVVSGIAAVYLIYCIIMTAVNIKYYKVDKKICWSCLKKKLLKLWLSLVVFGITSGIQLIIYTFALPLILSPLRIPFMILIILLSVGLQMSVPSLLRPLQSPIFGHDIFLKSTEEINVGDLLELKYFKLPHIILVTEVHSTKVRAIHYAAPSHPFARRIVKEEYFSINSSSVKMKYMLSKCYPPNVVVERARKRLGETKFNMWSNRSSHLCNWAKVDLRAESVSGVDDHSLDRPKSNDKSSLKVCNREVHLVDELEEGDVVILDKINMLPFWVSDEFPFMSPFMVPFILLNTYVQGIILDIKGNREESITLELLVHIGVQVCRVRVHIDLKTERLFVCKYLGGHCKSMRDRVTAALEMANKWQIFFTNKAFVEACVMRHPE